MPLLALLAVMAVGSTREIAAEEPGAILYQRYCAACHGRTGRGDGPAASALTPPPTDLTRVEKREPELMAIIDGRRPVRAHGTSAMPIWGTVFEQSLIGQPHARRTALLQVQTLSRYVEGLQRKEPPPAP